MAFSGSSRMARSDVKAILADLARFKEGFREQVGLEILRVGEAAREFERMTADELMELGKRIESLIDDLEGMMLELEQRERLRLDQVEGIQLASTEATLREELDSLTALLAQLEGELSKRNEDPEGARRTLSALLSFFKPLIKTIARRLWRLISGLLTPKEWSVGGEVGNTVWGLTKVKLEIKFGP